MEGRNLLVGVRGAADVLGVEEGELLCLLRDTPFPGPVASVAGHRAWLRTEVEAYRNGMPYPEREDYELEGEVLAVRDVARIVGRSPSRVTAGVADRRWHLVPRPAGRVGQAHVWWREDVAAWVKRRDAEKEARKARAETIARKLGGPLDREARAELHREARKLGMTLREVAAISDVSRMMILRDGQRDS